MDVINVEQVFPASHGANWLGAHVQFRLVSRRRLAHAPLWLSSEYLPTFVPREA